LQKLLDHDRIYYGGKIDRERRFISPTILQNISFDDEIMQDEIFGPILPVVSYTDLDEAIQHVKARPKPLACYVYSKNRKTIAKVLKEVSFGGGAVNESVMHFANSNLPFGGVGSSGMGSYHGKSGFDTFSHFKSILDKPFWFEANIKYSPYSKNKLKIIKWLFK
jgi:aldehyde dehydrogenase (NAD+)